MAGTIAVWSLTTLWWIMFLLISEFHFQMIPSAAYFGYALFLCSSIHLWMLIKWFSPLSCSLIFIRCYEIIPHNLHACSLWCLFFLVNITRLAGLKNDVNRKSGWFTAIDWNFRVVIPLQADCFFFFCLPVGVVSESEPIELLKNVNTCDIHMSF